MFALNSIDIDKEREDRANVLWDFKNGDGETTGYYGGV